MKLNPIKVSVLNQYIKKYLLSNPILNNLRVEGEISNIRMSKTGYTYFTLGDNDSVINCVAFFADNISKNGDKVIIDGEISLYEAKGNYQLIVRNIERIGLGKILADLELLKEKLKKEGMFDRHRDIPVYPNKIGIITSKSGAAIQDILKTIEQVRGDFEITIYNALVQGEKSKGNIINGIRYFNKNNMDVIMIARGGGSFEDLNVFNDIDVAKEAYNSTVPVVTGIGHETDRTLTDYVADIYCHTPTAAAERVIKGYKDAEQRLLSYMFLLKQGTYNKINLKKAEIKSYRYMLKTFIPVEYIYKTKNEIDNYKNIMKNNMQMIMHDFNSQLSITAEKLSSYNYQRQLEKGYSIATNNNGIIIKTKDQVRINDTVNIRFSSFKITAATTDVEEV